MKRRRDLSIPPESVPAVKAILDNGLAVDCTGFKAIDSGVVLLGEGDDRVPIGFVPNERLACVLPDDVVERDRERLTAATPTDAGPAADATGPSTDDPLTGGVSGEACGNGGRSDDESVESLRMEIDERFERLEGQIRALASATEGAALPSGTERAGRTSVDEVTEGDEADIDEADVDASDDRTSDESGAAVDGDEAESGASTDGESAVDLSEIDGLGSTYRDRLVNAGIGSVGELADRDVAEVAEAAEAPESRAEDWIEQARRRTERRSAA